MRADGRQRVTGKRKVTVVPLAEMARKGDGDMHAGRPSTAVRATDARDR